MKRLVAALGIVWAAANVVVAFFFLTNAFTAKTAIKEGLPAQAALLLGGLFIGLFAVLLARTCVELFRGRSAAEI